MPFVRELQTYEVYWNSAAYSYNDYSLYMEDGSNLTVDSCSFESVNDQSGARTSFGVHTATGGTLVVRNNTSFKGFRGDSLDSRC